MKILYRNFFPEVKEKGFFPHTYETLSEILDKANTWTEMQGVDVINVETIVLSNVNNDETSAVDSYSSGSSQTYWSQFIRVWLPNLIDFSCNTNLF